MSTERTMRIATGETRPIIKVWPNGFYDCPWCGGVNSAEQEQCANPACWASAYATVEHVRAEQERIARHKQEAAERASAVEAQTRREREAREADHLLWQERRADAEERGACVQCLRKSSWRYQPRYIRHRRDDFHAREDAA